MLNNILDSAHLRFVFFLSFLSCISFAQAKSPGTDSLIEPPTTQNQLQSSDQHSLDELSPLLDKLSASKSSYEAAKELEKFLEKATDIAIATLKKSGSTIPQEKLKRLRRDIHDQLEDLVDDLYIPLDID